MITPYKGTPTYAKDNMNGLLLSILAWLGGVNQTVGLREFDGFSIYSTSILEPLDLPIGCQSAMTERIKCDPVLNSMMSAKYHGSLNNDTLTESICDATCGQNLQAWYQSVQLNCAGYNISGTPAEMFGGRIWAAYNETCSKDKSLGKYCNGTLNTSNYYSTHLTGVDRCH